MKLPDCGVDVKIVVGNPIAKLAGNGTTPWLLPVEGMNTANAAKSAAFKLLFIEFPLSTDHRSRDQYQPKVVESQPLSFGSLSFGSRRVLFFG
jgi:hypothetical protein